MKKNKYLFLITIILNSNLLNGQKVFSYLINDFAEVNPAGLSIIDSYQLDIKGFNSPEFNQFFNGGDLKIVAPIEKINSRIGIHVQFSSHNDLSDFKYGLSYSYIYRFTENSFLALGSKASVFSMKDKYFMYNINYHSYGESDFQSYKLNIDAGIWFQNNNLGVGLSYNHINSPEHKAGVDLNPLYPNPYLYEPEFNIMVNHKLRISENLTMNNSMIMYDLINMNELTDININNIFALNNTFIFGSAWEILSNDETRIQFYNIFGFNLMDKYRIYISHAIQDYLSDKNLFINTSKKIKPRFECSFSIKI